MPIPLLSPQTQVSLLTCSPSDDAVFTLYGHTALRVLDSPTNIDIVFNYGEFDFSAPYFIYRFAKGEMNYCLGYETFTTFLNKYMMRGSKICEQVLNLLPEEKEKLWKALSQNSLPENRTYRYNYFFDNCATRSVAIIDNNIQGFIYYSTPTTYPTFRNAINYCTRNHPWITFGCDLVLGLPADHVMTHLETFFIPDYLKIAFDKAEIIRGDSVAPLVLNTNIFNEKNILSKQSPSPLLSPLSCFTLFFILLLVITYTEWKRKAFHRWLDCILFFIAGIAGCILYYLCFISTHPAVFPNISTLWLHPFHLVGGLFFSTKRMNRVGFWYHSINFIVIFIVFVAWFFIPQHFNLAFIPLIACLLLRSGTILLRKKFRIL